MPQESPDALSYSTLRKVDGTIIDHRGVTLPDGTQISHQEYDTRQKGHENSDQLLDQHMMEDVTRSSGTKQE